MKMTLKHTTYDYKTACALLPMYAAVSIFLCIILSFIFPVQALAEPIDTNPVADGFQQEVERTAQEYNDAIARLDEIDALMAENQADIAVLNATLPHQKQLGAQAATTLYKLQSDTCNLIDFILSAESFSDFIRGVDYLNYINESNVKELQRLNQMETDLKNAEDNLAAQHAEAEKKAQEAEIALSAAQEARKEAQRKAEEEAKRQAELEAEKAAAQEEAMSQSKDAKDALTEQPQEDSSSSLSDNVDWSVDKTEFVNAWASRIDAYLAGSPLAGQGATFASAAWDYGVDPRWSPAISNTESSKGLYCFASHNAWGWGSCSWDSWEEAINAHVAGLARGYGYTISYDAARKYCPPNADHWYNATLAQMNMI